MERGHLARCLRESNKNEGIDEKKDDTLRDTLLGSAKNIADTDGIEAINILIERRKSQWLNNTRI